MGAKNDPNIEREGPQTEVQRKRRGALGIVKQMHVGMVPYEGLHDTARTILAHAITYQHMEFNVIPVRRSKALQAGQDMIAFIPAGNGHTYPGYGRQRGQCGLKHARESGR
jgi:hypothetical protein